MSTEKRCVVVRGTSSDVTQQELMQSCADVGEVEEVWWREDREGEQTGSAFIIYKRESDVLRAIDLATKGRLHVEYIKTNQKQELTDLIQTTEAHTIFNEAYKLLTPAKKKQVMKSLREESASAVDTAPLVLTGVVVSSADTTPVVATRVVASSADTTPVVATRVVASSADTTPVVSTRVVTTLPSLPVAAWQETPRLCSFSGLPGKESDYSRWRYEVLCLVREKQSEGTILTAIRRSLKAPASDVMRRLGEVATLDQVLQKLQALYGKVLEGDALLQKFYGEQQRDNEGVVEWSCRLDEYLFEAIEQGAAPMSMRAKLAHRFWDGLLDDRLRSALRHRNLPFDDLVIEARRIEEEYQASPNTSRTAGVRSQPVTLPPPQSTNEKLDLLLDRLKTLETQVQDMSAAKTASKTWDKPTTTSRPGLTSPAVRPLTCMKCQKQGHLTFGCRADTNMVCYKCQTVGHISASCLNEVAPRR
jgi:hypothetical protein